MAEEAKKAPNLRFRGFADDWEQRKLGDLAEVRTGKAFSSADFNDAGEYLVVTNKNIQDNTNGITSVGDRINISEEPILNNYLLKGNNILVTMDGVNIGKTGKYSNKKAVLAQRVGRLNSKQLEFIYQVTNNNRFLSEMNKLSVGNAIKHISLKQISDYSFAAPINEKEQEKIGIFFKQLDETIALHQRKLTLLEQLKQTYLQALFPQNEKNIPALRFAGFSDPWEQRKVGEYLTESRIPGTDGSVAKKLTVKLWRKGVIPKEESYQGSAATNYFIRKSGQFIYGKLDFLNQAFGIVPYHLDGYESTLDSPAFDIFPTMNSIFFLEYVSRKEFYLYQGTLANGSRKAKRIHAETFFEMPINVPSNEEQNKIGNFLKQFDDTIALHQSNLQKFSELKKVLLSKMFV